VWVCVGLGKKWMRQLGIEGQGGGKSKSGREAKQKTCSFLVRIVLDFNEELGKKEIK